MYTSREDKTLSSCSTISQIIIWPVSYLGGTSRGSFFKDGTLKRRGCPNLLAFLLLFPPPKLSSKKKNVSHYKDGQNKLYQQQGGVDLMIHEY